MRNPIQPSPARPIPLPDCILLDAWWADREQELRQGASLRLVTDSRDDRTARPNAERRPD